MTSERARQLLDPADKQNVPKAVTLLQELRKVESTPQPEQPSDALRYQRIRFLARFFEFFLLPFISLQMSLAEQVRSLATYAHLLVIMWKRHGTSFITGALYTDSQSIIKDIIFNIARLQLLNPDTVYYIILDGTDRLERLFSDCCTQDHSRNFDILQFCDKISIGTMIRLVYERHPELDRGHTRLNLKDAMGVDYVNPFSWIGDVRVGTVNLATEWNTGRTNALKVLKDFLTIDDIDFTPFTSESADFLRPMGTYVGVDFCDDDARTHAAGSEAPLSLHFQDESEDIRNYYQHQDSHADARSTHTPELAHYSADIYDSDNEDHWDDDDDEFEDLPEGVDLEQLILFNREDMDDEAENEGYKDATEGRNGEGTIETVPLTVSSSEHQAQQPLSSGGSPLETTYCSDLHHIIVDGRRYLTDSVVTAFLTSGRARKVTMRTLRARGVTIEDLRGKSALWDIPESDGDDDFVKCGDLVATLVRAQSVICLAVVEVLAFEKGGDQATRLTSVPFADFARWNGNLTALVQVLHMTPKQVAVAGVRSSTSSSEEWVWSGEYLDIGEDGQHADHDERHEQALRRTTRKNYLLMVPSFLLRPLTPSVIPMDALAVPSSRAQIVSEEPSSPLWKKHTWKLSQTQLDDAVQDAWDLLAPDTADIVVNITRLPSVKSKNLPYTNGEGTYIFVASRSYKQWLTFSVSICVCCREYSRVHQYGDPQRQR